MIESYDGLCGIIANFSSSDLRLRCHYELAHEGKCSFEKYKRYFRISSSCVSSCSLNKKDDDGIKSVLSHKK